MESRVILTEFICDRRLPHMNSVKMTLLSMSSCSSVDGELAQCSGGLGFDSCNPSSM